MTNPSEPKPDEGMQNIDVTREANKGPDNTVVLDVPRQLGTYRLSRMLGRGGMGEVWQAFDISLERHVAIKLMRKDLLGNEDATRRFSREARAVARLNHPNIVQVYAFGDEKGLLYFVMELVDGKTVSERLREGGCIPLSEAVGFLMQAVDGLDYACERGIIHRDIKPSNLMITSGGQLKIADFGLAKMVENDTQMTMAGTAMGSPNYMSPEQARGEEADHRSDIYALGVSLFQMLCGKLPFTANSPVSVLLKQVQEPLPESEQIHQLDNGAAMAVLRKMTAKAPAHRYQTYAELAAALAALQPGTHYTNAFSATASMQPPTQPLAPQPTTSTPLAHPGSEAPSAAVPENARSQPSPAGHIPSSATTDPATNKPAGNSGPGFVTAGLVMLGMLIICVLAYMYVVKMNREAGTFANATSNPYKQQTSSAPEIGATGPNTTANSAQPAPAGSPSALNGTPAPSSPAHTPPSASAATFPSGAGRPAKQTMAPVDISASIGTPTPFPGQTSVVTPRPRLDDLLPSGMSVAKSNPDAPLPVYVLGTAGGPANEMVPTYIDSTARQPYKSYPAGTRVSLISDGAAMIRVMSPDKKPVYVYRKMAAPAP